MQDRFNLRYVYKNKIYDVFAVDFCEGKAQLVSLNGSEMLFTKIDTDKLFQCTGLRDKNGKLIYEGDIVKDDHEALHYVKWGYNAYQLNPVSKDGYTIGIVDDEIEVIGNIYEHLELLEVDIANI